MDNLREVSCPCGGSNENCYRCAGSGTIRTAVPPPQTVYHPLKTAQLAASPEPMSTSAIPFKTPSWKKRLEEMDRPKPRPPRQSSSPKAQASTKTTDSPPAGMVPCPHCNHVVWVKKAKLPKHINRVHSAKLLPKPEPEPQPPGKRIHYLYANPGKIKISSTGKSRPTPDLAPKLEDEQYLDGSANSHIRRDQGRFGSHPSFDAMDDDSNP